MYVVWKSASLKQNNTQNECTYTVKIMIILSLDGYQIEKI